MLEELLFLHKAPAPSGMEGTRARTLLELAATLGMDGRTDKLGNVIIRKNGAGRRILLAAPLDEPSVMCCTADDKGFLRVKAVGVSKPELCAGRQVGFAGGLTGIIGLSQTKDGAPADLWCDIGAQDREKALNLCPPGSAGTFVYPAPKQNGGRIEGGGISASAGAALLLRLIKTLEGQTGDLFFVFHAQKHTGHRGLQTAAFSCEPDMAVLLDAVPAGDTPDAKGVAVDSVAVKLSEGTVSYDAELSARFLERAGAFGAKASPYLSPDAPAGADAAQFAGQGCRVCALALPVRFFGAAWEVACLSAFEGALALLRDFLRSVTSDA